MSQVGAAGRLDRFHAIRRGLAERGVHQAPFSSKTRPWLRAFSITCGAHWGPYFAELYPEHLRTTAASIINWGRIVSLVGSVFTGWIAQHYGLYTIMFVGGFTYAAAH